VARFFILLTIYIGLSWAVFSHADGWVQGGIPYSFVTSKPGSGLVPLPDDYIFAKVSAKFDDWEFGYKYGKHGVSLKKETDSVIVLIFGAPINMAFCQANIAGGETVQLPLNRDEYDIGHVFVIDFGGSKFVNRVECYGRNSDDNFLSDEGSIEVWYRDVSKPRICTGDRNNDGKVTVDEIINAVTNALYGCRANLKCEGDRNGDGQVTVDELTTAVGDSLSGCSAAP
jgi:hypothetical protein